MQIVVSSYGLFERLARLKDALNGDSEEFVCRDCERWQSCGLPPSKTCVLRAAQLERGDWKRRRGARTRAVM